MPLTRSFRAFSLCALTFLCTVSPSAGAQDGPVYLSGGGGVRAVFERSPDGWLWTACEDTVAGSRWAIAGPRFSLQTPDGNRIGLAGADTIDLEQTRSGGVEQVLLRATFSSPPVELRQTCSFCADGRTLRIQSALRATGAPVTIQRVGLLEVQVEGQPLELTGPSHVSCPVFGNEIFAGVEHPSAWCQVDGDTLYLAQHSYVEVTDAWTELPPAVFGAVSPEDRVVCGAREGLRRSFLRYLDTVRVKPADMHVHYNDWWTAPVPSSEAFVLNNIARLKQDLFDVTGFFFDSYAMDMGWSDAHSVWQIDAGHFPEGFSRIRDALAAVHARPGLWVSPSSLYPPALDNAWLQSAGYEVTPHATLGLNACLARNGKYQTAFKDAVLKHAQAANLAHVKFDGFVPDCEVDTHGHHPGPESYLPIAEGLMEVFDALRARAPGIALEPTCFGYRPSPWWLMHVPFLIGPFGDDSPLGRCPCPEWIEAMTTARDIENLAGRDAFLMPSSALQCFDIIVQCPGAFQNHAAMAIGRGRWFISSYINPEFMDRGEWQFFAELIAWARHNREFLQEPMPVGGDPAQREPYGYVFSGPGRRLFCLRNPWLEEAAFTLPETFRNAPFSPVTEIRTVYPRREVLARVQSGAPLPELHLEPYETVFVEQVPKEEPPHILSDRVSPAPRIEMTVAQAPIVERTVFEEDPAPFGPSWTSPTGDANEMVSFRATVDLTLAGIGSAEVCVLCEGPPDVALSACSLAVDGVDAPVTTAASAGAFSATGRPVEEHWIWFMAPVPEGRHTVDVRLNPAAAASTVAVFVRGAAPARPSDAPFDSAPAFPLYRPELRSWSRTLIPPVACNTGAAVVQRRPREISTIDGVYLDTLTWSEATAGWGEVRLNRSVMDKPMTMAGRRYLRGIGTHADSRIDYALPGGFKTFAATAGYDQEVRGGSVVFVVKGDDRELFRSPVAGRDTPPIEVRVPLDGVSRLSLIVEDAGDGIAADHANWADARLLK